MRALVMLRRRKGDRHLFLLSLHMLGFCTRFCLFYDSDLLGEMHEFQSTELLIRSEILWNLEALRSATTIAAKILQQESDLGRIAVGAIADVLVVDGNPLQDIRCLTGQGEAISGILQEGRVIKSNRVEERQASIAR